MGAYCPALCKNTRLVEAVVVVVLLLQISSFLITCTSRSPSRVMNAIYGGGTTLAGRREEASVHSPCSQEEEESEALILILDGTVQLVFILALFRLSRKTSNPRSAPSKQEGNGPIDQRATRAMTQ